MFIDFTTNGIAICLEADHERGSGENFENYRIYADFDRFFVVCSLQVATRDAY